VYIELEALESQRNALYKCSTYLLTYLQRCVFYTLGPSECYLWIRASCNIIIVVIYYAKEAATCKSLEVGYRYY